MKKVSIVMPVYNGTNYVTDALYSVMDQDYPNIEIVASISTMTTDHTREVMEKFPVRFVDGGGYEDNWQRAAEGATGDYVKLLCHDDVLLPGCISSQVKVLDENPEVWLTGCQQKYIDSFGNKSGENAAYYFDTYLKRKDMGALLVNLGNVIGEVSACLWRRHDFIWNPVSWAITDCYMYMQLLEHGDFYYQAEMLTAIRKHDGQDTHNCLKFPDYHEREAKSKRLLEEHFFSKVLSTP